MFFFFYMKIFDYEYCQIEYLERYLASNYYYKILL